MAEHAKDLEDKENKTKDGEKEEEKRHKKEEMKMLVSKLEDLKGPPLEIPEYKAAYKVSYFNNYNITKHNNNYAKIKINFPIIFNFYIKRTFQERGQSW